MIVGDREGLVARIGQIRRMKAGTGASARRSTVGPQGDGLPALEARIADLERMVEGLQDAVYRESERHGKLIAELQAQIRPGMMGAALAEDARSRGLQAHLTAFFIPGLGDDPHAVEGAYRDMSGVIEFEMGRPPRACRIRRLWTRRGSMDCITEVGHADPLRGGTVMAIFDMGLHQPFVVWWQPDTERRDGVREVLGCKAYAVLEFDS